LCSDSDFACNFEIKIWFFTNLFIIYFYKFWKNANEYSDIGFVSHMFSDSFDKSSLRKESETFVEESSEFKFISISNKQLVESAAEQKHINFHICLLQYQLIRIIYLIIKYNMKSVKPLTFFDTKV
jgi:hypothetical protein